MFVSSFLISFQNFSPNFKGDILCLIFIFAFTFGSLATSGSVAGFAVVLSVRIWSKFFIVINLLLKLLRTVPFALNNNPKLFKK